MVKGITEDAESASYDAAAVVVGKLSAEMTSEFSGVIKKLSEEVETIHGKLGEMKTSLEDISVKGDQRRKKTRGNEGKAQVDLETGEGCEVSDGIGNGKEKISNHSTSSYAEAAKLDSRQGMDRKRQEERMDNTKKLQDTNERYKSRDGEWVLVEKLKRRNIKSLVGSKQD